MRNFKKILSLLVVTIMLIAIVPTASFASTQYGTVVGGWLRLRSGPSFDYDTVASYYTGTTVEILGTSGNWYQVKLTDGTTGYMYSSYVTLSSTSTGSGTMYVTSTNGYGVRMRSGPSTAYSIIKVYSVGTAVTVLQTGTYWNKIQVGTRVGYMMNQFLTTSSGTGTSGTSISVTPASSLAAQGEAVALTTTVQGTNLSSPAYTLSITQNASMASLSGTTLTVNSTATVGAVIKVTATSTDYNSSGSKVSATCSITVTDSTPTVTSIAISPTTSSVRQGESVTLNTTVNGSNLSSPSYTLSITGNSSLATLSGDVLTISATASVGAVIDITAISVDKNVYGYKLASTCHITVAAITVPQAPTLNAASAGDGQVALVWSPPSDNGGSAVTGYKVYYSTTTTMGTTPYTTTGAVATGVTVTGLTNSQTYYFWVVATNAIGDSTASSYLSAVPSATATVPDAPTALAVTSEGDSQVTVQWTAPANNGGSAITGYKLYKDGAYYGDSATSPATITGLTNGTTYAITVTAVNAVGESVSSSAVNVTPSAPATVPDAPTALIVTSEGDSQVTVQWTAPANNGGSAITGYKLYKDGAYYGDSATSPATITGLTNGTTYAITVTAVNAVGESVSSSAVNATPATTPLAPTSFLLTNGTLTTDVDLTWSTPTSNGSTITGYTIVYSTDSTFTPGNYQTTTVAVVNSETITLSTSGTWYFRIYANSSVGDGAYAEGNVVVTI